MQLPDECSEKTICHSLLFLQGKCNLLFLDNKVDETIVIWNFYFVSISAFEFSVKSIIVTRFFIGSSFWIFACYSIKCKMLKIYFCRFHLDWVEIQEIKFEWSTCGLKAQTKRFLMELPTLFIANKSADSPKYTS